MGKLFHCIFHSSSFLSVVVVVVVSASILEFVMRVLCILVCLLFHVQLFFIRYLKRRMEGRMNQAYYWCWDTQRALFTAETAADSARSRSAMPSFAVQNFAACQNPCGSVS